ncbi:MAG: iron-containing alcohol dehydrogenase [Clostridiales bacterium]|nr:iron-containing alcohol dehydrogenase [Clostridiales bacterium]
MDILNCDRRYQCLCGLGVAFDHVAAYVLEHTGVKDPKDLKVAVVSDRAVSGYYYNRFENQFIERGVKPVLIPLLNMDTGKKLSVVEEILKYLTDFGFGPCDYMIALGGGSVLDATGFAAKIFDPGIGFIAIPTTLNAMIEGSVAGKARLNVSGRKDELSVPFDPDLVMIDPSFDKTIPSKVRSNGYAAVIRYAILDDLELITDLENPGDLREYLGRIYTSHTRIEQKDPRLLTLGNELAGAIEGYYRFMNYTEGEALALSLLASVDERRRQPLSRIYEVLGLPVTLRDAPVKMIVKTLEDSLRRQGKRMIDFVDLSGSRWVVRTAGTEEALDVFTKRLMVISGVDDK